MTITEDFESFQFLNFESSLLKKQELFLKTWSTVSQFRVLFMKEQHFHTKPPCQKSMLRQIEWGVQNRPITKNGLSPLTTSFI